MGAFICFNSIREFFSFLNSCSLTGQAKNKVVAKYFLLKCLLLCFGLALSIQGRALDLTDSFLVFVEEDAKLTFNETEAGIAIGGDLIIDNHVAITSQGSSANAAYRVDLLSGSTYDYLGNTVSLIVGGAVQYVDGQSLTVIPTGNFMLLGGCSGSTITNPNITST